MGEKLLAACRTALEENLGLTPGESLLIVTDQSRLWMGEALRGAAEAITPKVDFLQIPTLAVNGREPPLRASSKMIQADVVVAPLSKSISWTKARRAATREGARVATMPGITRGIALRTFFADYRTIRKRVNLLCDLLDEATRVRVTTGLGTDLTLSIKGRRGRGRNGGIYRKPGAWGNLPCGEAFIAPVEGSAEGCYVVDLAHAGLANLTRPVTITVRAGKAVDFEGGEGADHLAELLQSTGSSDAFNLAELGIGCNEKAERKGITLEAEKALGTCHLALGSNYLFGGTVDVGIHLDGVMASPTLYFDGKPVVNDGELLIDF